MTNTIKNRLINLLFTRIFPRKYNGVTRNMSEFRNNLKIRITETGRVYTFDGSDKPAAGTYRLVPDYSPEPKEYVKTDPEYQLCIREGQDLTIAAGVIPPGEYALMKAKAVATWKYKAGDLLWHYKGERYVIVSPRVRNVSTGAQDQLGYVYEKVDGASEGAFWRGKGEMEHPDKFWLAVLK